MKILGIESSQTKQPQQWLKRPYLARKFSHKLKPSKLFGGVVPEIAAREHLKVIHPLCQKLDDAGVTLKDIDGIAVTQGPGLVALLVGISYAKGLAMATGKQLIPVNHVHAYVHGALLGLMLS